MNHNITDCRHVLHIDDDEDDREFFRAALTEVNPLLQCISMANAIQALDQLSSASINPALIIVDLNMPKFNGFEFLIALRHNIQVLPPIVILTTSRSAADKEKASQLGASEFITKPGSYVKLCDLIDRLLLRFYLK